MNDRLPEDKRKHIFTKLYDILHDDARRGRIKTDLTETEWAKKLGCSVSQFYRALKRLLSLGWVFKTFRAGRRIIHYVLRFGDEIEPEQALTVGPESKRVEPEPAPVSSDSPEEREKTRSALEALRKQVTAPAPARLNADQLETERGAATLLLRRGKEGGPAGRWPGREVARGDNPAAPSAGIERSSAHARAKRRRLTARGGPQ